MSLTDKCCWVLCLRGLLQNFMFLTTSGSLKMDSCLVLTKCLSSNSLLQTSAIDFIHSERVSTSTSSLFAHRLAYSLHASMIMPKFVCHECETGSLYFGPLLKRSLSTNYIEITCHYTCHYTATWSVQKL